MLRKIIFVISISLMFSMAAFAQETSSPTAVKAEPGKKPAVFRPTKDQIKQVQAMLKEKKLYTSEPSGKYDDATRVGIRSFQKDNGLTETGTLNRATLEKFGVELTDSQKMIPVSPNSIASKDKPADKGTKSKPAVKSTISATSSTAATSAASEEKPKRMPPFRATADQVKAAQKMMKEKSMYAGDETGKLDDATRDGLKKFQEGAGMKVTGTLNAATLEKMGIALTDKQKADAAAASTTTHPKN